ncbi:uncharacterized protein V1513DRAFT_408819 [Lipomyces chichibuensis]|uniref:uncharacterized protein n=1 Tax=Lipomyces chichibuensis TaxID=1546026 RepID=UPI003343CA45
MASSLGRQLSLIKANAVTASTLDRKRRQKSHAVSLIYDPKDAITQDLDSIYLVALKGLQDLESIDHRFRTFEKSLFSETSISIDRYVQTPEQNAVLDRAVESFLALIGPRVLLQPAIQALEWLVRRFKINELNAEILLLTFLPYYSHPIFSRVLDTISLPLPPLFSFLSNSKTTATTPPRNLLTRALSRDAELFSLISEHVITHINAHHEYHALLSFWTSATISAILSMKEAKIFEETIAERTLPHLSTVITARKSPEAQTAAYMIVVVLVSQCRLGNDVLDALAKGIALNWTTKSSKTGLAALTQTLQFYDLPDGKYVPLDNGVWKAIEKIESLSQDLAEIKKKVKIDKFIVAYIHAILEYDHSNFELVFNLLSEQSLSVSQKSAVAHAILKIAHSSDASAETQSALGETLNKCLEDPALKDVFFDAMQQLNMDVDEMELKLKTTLQPAKPPPHQDDSMVEISSPPKVTFEQRINRARKPQHTSFLAPTATKQFEGLAEIYLQGLAEKKEVLSLLIKNENLFPSESGLALSFLLRMWTGSYPVLARVAALNFFGTLVHNMSETVDLQATIVYLLVALTDSSEKVRRAAAQCITVLSCRYEKSPKSPQIWGLESLYGAGSETDQLKWLGYKDLRVLLKDKIGPRSEEAVLDRDYIKSLIGNLVDGSVAISNEKRKKEVGFKTSVLAFLCSHITGSPFFRIKYCILSMLIASKKTPISLYALCTPLLGTWIKRRNTLIESLEREKVPSALFERTIMKVVVGSDQDGAKFLEDSIRTDVPGLSDAAGERIAELFDNWKYDTQLSLVRTLVDLALDNNVQFAALEVLNQLSLSTEIFSAIMSDSNLGTQHRDEPQQPSKRRRRSSTSQHQQSGAAWQSIHGNLRRLTLTLDLLERNQPQKHVPLLKQLFAILGELLLLKTDSSLPVQYTQQVLVDCMLPIIKTMDNSQLDSNSVRIDIIVSCIRSSTSPQVQNKFLLLVSALAKLSPELVLHSVMPIFTFMGANTIRQDDEFSAHVIQQTISQVIPALAQSTNSGDGIAFGTVELLLSFVNAFPHIPYHRRVKLFTTLVKTLGSHESLYLVLRLLGKRHWDAVAKGKVSDAQGLEDFVEVYLRGFTVNERIEAARRYLSLVIDIPFDLSMANETKSYLDDVTGFTSEKLLSSKLDLLRFFRIMVSGPSLRSEVAEIFRGTAAEISHSDIDAFQVSIGGCIEKLLFIIDTTSEEKYQEYQTEAYDSLDAVLNLLSIQDFVTVLETLISRLDDPLTVRRGLMLIRVKFEHDGTVSDNISKNSGLKILPSVGAAISNANIEDMELMKLGLQAIETLGSKFAAVEPDAFVGEILELVLDDRGIQCADENTAVSGLVCLSTLCTALGARMLGYLPRVVPIILDILEKAITIGQELVGIAVFAVIDSLIKRIPTFMGSYLTKILGLVFLSASSGPQDAFAESQSIGDARTVLLENVIAKIQTRPLLASLILNWDDVIARSDYAIIKFYLFTATQVIERGTRKAVMSDASKLFDFLLSAFNSRNVLGEPGKAIVNDLEMEVIETAMQVVLKLNDKVFRPLFVRATKWATEAPVGSSTERRNRLLIIYKFSERLFGSLKSIVTSYYGYIVEVTADLLVGFVTGKTKLDRELWDSVIGSLIAAFSNDQTEFWQAPVRFDKIADSLLAQLALGVHSSDLLQRAIVAFAVSCSSEDHYKRINKSILDYMRDLDDEDDIMADWQDAKEDSDAVILDPKRVAKTARLNADSTASDVKITAVKTLKAIYERLGEEWLSMLPQLVPVVAELLEDDDENVETEVRNDLVPVIEGILGESLDRYLT